MIKAVLFDMDGLMFDTETLATKSFIKAAKKQGYDMSVEETHLVLGYTSQAIYDFYKNYFKDTHVDGGKLVDDQYKIIEDVLFSTGPDKMPYLVELLEYLKNNGYKVAVASSSDILHIRNNLEKNDVLKYIDVIASGEEVAKGKPNPDVFLLAAERLGMLPEECLVLEDSYFGVQAGVAGGMKVVMVPDSVQPNEEILKIVYKVANNLKDVISILEEN